MQLIESLKMAIYTIYSNKMRTALTVLGIVIGIASVIAMVSLGKGNQVKMENEFKKMGSNRASIYVMPPDDQDIDDNDLFTRLDIKALRQEYGDKFRGVSFNGQLGTKYLSGKKEVTVNLSAVNETYQAIDSFKLIGGRFISQGDVDSGRHVVVLDVEMADKQFGTRDIIGKQLTLQHGDSSVSYAIVGLYSKPKSAFEMNVKSYGGYIPITAYIVDTGTSYFEEIQMSLKDQYSISEDIKTLSSFIAKRHSGTDKSFYRAFNAQKEMDMMNKFSNSMTLFISVIAGISLVVGGIGIMNIMMVSVSERTREIGIRKAIGATRKDILSQFLVESSLLSGIGGVIGIAFGMGIATIGGQMVSISPVVEVGTIIMTVLFSTGMGVFFGMYPAHKASKLSPIDALRYE